MAAESGAGRVTGVILAAGPSTRFGTDEPKQLFEIDGEAMVRRVARAALASRLRQILVVVGHESERVVARLIGLAVEVVDNPLYAAGQSSSVKTGLSRVEGGAAAAMFIPCDQPFLTARVIDRLLEAFENTRAPIVVPVHDGRRDSPALIARNLFSELAEIDGDQGGRQLFAAHENRLVECPFEHGEPFRDFDLRPDSEHPNPRG